MSARAKGLVTAAALTAVVAGTPSARAHFPHDVIAAVAVDGEGDDARIAAQYLFPGRPLLLRSDDGGQRWSFHAVDAASDVLQQLAFADDGTLFAVDGLGATAWRSDDGGQSWTETAPVGAGPLRCVAPSPGFADEPVLFAGTEHGLWRSDDGGGHWGQLVTLEATRIEQIELAADFPVEPIAVVRSSTDGVWRSIDGGVSWTPQLAPLAVGEPTALALSPEVAEDGRLWVGAADGKLWIGDALGAEWTAVEPAVDDGGPLGEPIQDLWALPGDRLLAITDRHAALCSLDGGTSWDLCDDGVPGLAAQFSSEWGHYRQLRAPRGGDAPVVIAAWEGLLASDDGGARWEERCTVLPTYTRGLAFSPGYPVDPTLWVGSYGGGIYATVDGGIDWSVLGDGQEHLYGEAVAPSPAFPADAYLFAIASRRLLRSDDRGTTFEAVDVPGLTFAHQVVLSPAFDVDRSLWLVGTTVDEGHWVLAHSADAGVSWQLIHVGDAPPAPQLVSVTAPDAFADDGVLYGIQTAPSAVLRSADLGAGWDAVLTPGNGAEIAALAPAITEQGEWLVAVAADGQVWRSQLPDGPWVVQPPLGTGVWRGDAVGGGAVVLSLDPPGLARSLDGGALFDVLPTPFDSLVLATATSPSYPDDPTLVASTHYGAFFSCDDGQSWSLLDRVMRLEDGACPLRYHGTGWRRSVGAHTGTTAMRSDRAGDTLEVTFDGSGVRWLASTFPGGGRGRVTVDGAALGEVTLAADEPGETGVVFEHFAASAGLHTLTIEVLGEGPVEIDALEILRTVVTNGDGELYRVGDWCTELPAGPIVLHGACCPQACAQEAGPRAGATGPVVALLMALVWSRSVRAARRRRRGSSR